MLPHDVSGAAAFFTARSVKFHDKAPQRGRYLYEEVTEKGKVVDKTFIPFIEAEVSTEEQVRSDTLYAKAYFYDSKKNLIEKADKPSPVERGAKNLYAMPVFFPKSEPESVYFAVPKKVLDTPGWEAVVVFGDKDGAAAAVLPKDRMVTLFDFPERPQVDSPKRAERQEAMNPVIEHVVQTHNLKQPQITLFLRPPLGMTKASEANGVLAMCLLANNVGEIKRRLQQLEAKDEVGGLIKFAEKNKLVILCWGSTNLWDPTKNWDEVKKQTLKNMDETFDDVSSAWCKGVEQLSRKYGLPNKDFLLWGSSGSAQYAKRLALRQPQYFLAVHLHIPSSFDKPTPEAKSVLWCLTTGELESGYERSKKFYTQCRELGYPMIYKAVVGIGHEGHWTADNLGLRFFEWALELRNEKTKLDAEMADTFSKVRKEWEENPQRPWPLSFREPQFVGDIVNQEMFPINQSNMVPESFRVLLPTKELADAWSKK